jgi:prevent-host-death family protein
VTTIPQRELRNHVSDVLRRAESGESFVVTVDGRPVAELGPLARSRRPATAAQLKRMLADAPVDADWAPELETARTQDDATAVDAWDN